MSIAVGVKTLDRNSNMCPPDPDMDEFLRAKAEEERKKKKKAAEDAATKKKAGDTAITIEDGDLVYLPPVPTT